MFIDKEERKRVLWELLETKHTTNSQENQPRKLFIEVEWKKYIILHGYNINKKWVKPDKDIKQRYAATLKSYKIIYNKLKDKYYPNKMPYDIRIPPILYFSHTEKEDIIIQKYIEWKTYEELFSNHNTPDKDRNTLALFHNDRLDITNEIWTYEHGIWQSTKTFDIKIKNKLIRVLEDFEGKTDNQGNALPPYGDNIICTKEKNRITFRLTDAVMSRYII
jgi:hypothetical protein